MAHCDESVPVHDVNLAWRELHGTFRDLTRHVRGVIVDDEGVCIHAHPCQQPTGLAMAGLDIWDVSHAASEHGGALVNHALQHEGVDAVVGPSMADGQGFDHEQGEVPFDREVYGMLEGEVVDVRLDEVIQYSTCAPLCPSFADLTAKRGLRCSR